MVLPFPFPEERPPLLPGMQGPMGPLGGMSLPPGLPPLGPSPTPPPPPGLLSMLGGGPPQLPGPPLPPAQMMGPMQPPQGGLGGPMADPAAMFESPEFWTMVQQYLDQQDMQREQASAEPQNKQTKKKRKNLNEQQIRQRIDRVIAFWQPRDERMDADYQIYSLAADVGGDGEVIVSNLPAVVVEKTANLIGSQKPIITIHPPKEDVREQCQLGENYLRWCWSKWDKQLRRTNFNGPLYRDMAYFLALRGWLAIRISYNPDAEEHENPVGIKLYDPRQVYPAMGGEYVVHQYWITIGELIEEWPEAEKEYGERDYTDRVEVEAYYDDWVHTVYADGKVIKKPTPHEYGFVPWIITTGHGSPVRATQSNQENWVREVGVSIFHSVRDVYQQLNKILSQIATDVAKSANPPILYYYDPANPDEPKPLNLSPGSANYLIYDRERAEPLNLSTKPQEVGPLIDKLLGDIQKGTLPDILWGAGAGPSGLTSSILTDTARDGLFPIVSALENAMEQVNECTLKLVRDQHDTSVGFFVKDRTTGDWRGDAVIGPGEIEEIGTENEVRYRDIAPKDRAQLAQLASMLTKEKLISMETARDEYLGIENPERENERVLADLLYLDEKVTKDVLVPLALRRTEPDMFLMWQLSKMQDRLAGQQPQGGPPMGGGGPPPMGGPPPGMPGIPPLSGGGPPGMPPNVMAPLAQPGADPMAQSLGSILGGLGAQRPPGLPGAGAPQLPLPLA